MRTMLKPQMAWLLGASLLLNACVSRTPISDSEQEALVGVQVSFLTNRDLQTNGGGERFFGNRRGEHGAGVCSVVLEAPEELRGKARVTNVRQTEATELPTGGSSRVVLYVHGYNIGFEKGCRRSARLTQNAGLEEQLLLFSWPANGNYLNYVGDVADMTWSVSYLEQVLRHLAQKYGRVDLIGHSLGARGLVEALVNLSRAGETAPEFGSLVLSAPDVDVEVFTQSLHRLMTVVSDLTIYISSKDRALSMSSQLHGYRRLGQVGLSEPVSGVDVVDVSEVKAREVSGHLYHLYNPAVVEDLRAVLDTLEDPRVYQREPTSLGFRLQPMSE